MLYFSPINSYIQKCIELTIKCMNMVIALHYLFTQKNSSVHEYNTSNRYKLCLAIATHVYREKDFEFVFVHVWNYISE